MKRILQSTFVFAIAMTISVSNVKAQDLEEIIVTATKKEESLQDVSVSVSVIDGDLIEKQAIQSLKDLGRYVPNFSVSENAISTIATMRGVSIGANQSFEQSVGLFVDGVHLPKGRQFRTGLFDVERVEVLRGPQGTLFGKNTLTGALNVISAKPIIGGDDISGKVSIAASDEDGGTEVEGHLNIPLSDAFAVRLAWQDRENDGTINNLYNGSTGPTADETMLRLSASYSPNDNLRIDFKHTDGEHVRTGSTSTPWTFDQAMPPTPTSGLGFAVMNIFYPQYLSAVGTGDQYTDENLGFSTSQVIGNNPQGTVTNTQDTSLNVSYDMDNDMNLSLTIGQAGYDYVDGLDADYGPLVLVSRDDWSDYEKDSVEIRLSSDQSQSVRWTVGAYWDSQYQDIDREVHIDGNLGGVGTTLFQLGILPTTTIMALNGAQAAGAGLVNVLPFPWASPHGITYFPGMPLVANPGCEYGKLLAGFGAGNFPPCFFQTQFDQIGRLSNWTQETDAKAVFGQVSMDIADDMELIMGVRYVRERKVINADVCVSQDTLGISNCAGTTTNPYPVVQAILGSLFDTWAHDFNDIQRETDHWLPSLQLEKRLNEDNMIYFSYNKGYKSGGFNAADDQNPAFASVNGVKTALRTTPGIGFEYDDETADSIEVGGKHKLASNVRLNWAFAHANYNDQQVSTFQGTGFVVGNAATSTVNTIEMDLLWQATENLRVTAAAAWLDPKYDEFDTAACTELQNAYFRGVAGPANAYDAKALTTAVYGQNLTTPDGKCKVVWNGAGAYAGGNQDLSNQWNGSAKYSGSITLDYTNTLANGLEFFAGIDMNFSDTFIGTGDLDPIDTQEALELINARIGLRSDSWMFMLYGNNITDELFAVGMYDTPLLAGGHHIYQGDNRVVGARLTYEF
jgi:outer membrane receptor protein involved in Fe transport